MIHDKNAIKNLTSVVYTAKNEQPVPPDASSIEQCFAAHIVQGCQKYLLHLIAGYFRSMFQAQKLVQYC